MMQVATGAAALAALMFAITLWNAFTLRRLRASDVKISEVVSILVPARNEERRVQEVVLSLLRQQGLSDFEVIVLDDASTDATAKLLAEINHPNLRVISSSELSLPDGWLGKPWACQRLGEAARGSVLVFADADVVFEASAVASAVSALRADGLQLLSPFPRQEVGSAAERLIQPWITWLWLSSLPLWWAERSARTSLSAANGQFLVIDAASYRAVGGHKAVAGEVIDDINLMRAFKRAGFRAMPADASELAKCRMYEGSAELVSGYSKSLWKAFGGPLGSLLTLTLLFVAGVAPWVALGDNETRLLGLAGVLCSVGSRLVAARLTNSSAVSALAQPLATLYFGYLNLISWRRHLRGQNTWKGRVVDAG